jgi:hypothetical protein
MRQYGPRELRYAGHCAFNMNMAVDKTGRKIAAVQIHRLYRFILAEPNDHAVADGNGLGYDVS